MIHKFLNIKTLVIFNLLIIIAVFASRSLFVNGGLIHLIVILFIFLVLYIIFTKYSFSNRFLRVFLYLNLVNLFFLSASHVWELVTHRFIIVSGNVVEVMVLGLYFVSLFVVFLILRYISDIYNGKLDFDKKIFLIPFIIVIPFVYFILKLNHPAIVFVVGVIVFILTIVLGVFLTIKILKERETIPILRDFMKYLLVFIILVVFSSLFEFLEIFQFSSGALEFLTKSSAHFVIYFALSAYILSLVKLLSAKKFLEIQ